MIENRTPMSDISPDHECMIKFDKYDFPQYAEYAEYKHVVVYSVSRILVEDGLYVETGTGLFEIVAENRANLTGVRKEIIIVRNKLSGYFRAVFEPTMWKNIEHNDAFYYIFPTKEEYLSFNFRFIPIIEVDPFTRVKSIKWSEVGINTDNFPIRLLNNKSSSYEGIGTFNLVSSITLRFAFENIDNTDYITFYFKRNKIDNLYKNDRIIFLFDDDSKCEFEFNDNPLNNLNSNNEVFEIRSKIRKSDLITLSSKTLVRWRKISVRNNDEINDVVKNDWYNDEYFSYVLTAFVNKYLELIKKEISEDNTITEESKFELSKNAINEVCYVYLMLDTTNGYYKIGISNSPSYREKTLQSEKPTIDLLQTKSFPKRKIAEVFEKSIHHAYSNKRIRGEWFSLSDEDVEEILTILA